MKDRVAEFKQHPLWCTVWPRVAGPARQGAGIRRRLEVRRPTGSRSAASLGCAVVSRRDRRRATT